MRLADLTAEQLEGRTAICPYCKRKQPSSVALPYFDFNGPGSGSCSDCGYHPVAHVDQFPINPHTGRPNEVRKGGPCGKFRDEGRPFDTFFCGCRGWN